MVQMGDKWQAVLTVFFPGMKNIANFNLEWNTFGFLFY